MTPAPHNRALRLTTPYENSGDSARIQANVSTIHYDVVFRAMLAGIRGAQGAILGTFFKKFYDELMQECIPTHYDPDNESRIAAILERLNFRERPSTPDPESLQGHALDTAAGRPAARAKPRATKGVRNSVPRKAKQPTDIQGGTGGGVGPDRQKAKGKKG